jgi:hypothetical protein
LEYCLSFSLSLGINPVGLFHCTNILPPMHHKKRGSRKGRRFMQDHISKQTSLTFKLAWQTREIMK